MDKSGSFLKGALVLSIAGALSKIMGAIYRIPLARLLGGEGMGLYQMAYPIYTTILALATAGVPVAISVLVARQETRGYSGDSQQNISRFAGDPAGLRTGIDRTGHAECPLPG